MNTILKWIAGVDFIIAMIIFLLGNLQLGLALLSTGLFVYVVSEMP